MPDGSIDRSYASSVVVRATERPFDAIVCVSVFVYYASFLTVWNTRYIRAGI